jgi:hypothetical protein
MTIIIRFTCLLLLLMNTGCSIASPSAPKPDANFSTKPTPLQFTGRWSPNCERIGGLDIQNTDRITIDVNSNQIYILSRGTFHEDTLTLYLNHPEDLGRGGMMLDWNSFSKNEPIALIKLISKDTARIIWRGFYNKKTKVREWTAEPDFAEQNPQVLSKCKD